MADPVIKFLGKNGEFLSGLPAKDLTTQDYDELTNEQRATVRSSPLYDYVTYREALKTQTATPQEGSSNGG